MIFRKYILISLFLLFFAFTHSQACAYEKAEFSLTPEEKAWLAEHSKISIGIMDDWAPMNFIDENGAPDGIGVDYIKALNQRLSATFILIKKTGFLRIIMIVKTNGRLKTVSLSMNTRE